MKFKKNKKKNRFLKNEYKATLNKPINILKTDNDTYSFGNEITLNENKKYKYLRKTIFDKYQKNSTNLT